MERCNGQRRAVTEVLGSLYELNSWRSSGSGRKIIRTYITIILSTYTRYLVRWFSEVCDFYIILRSTHFYCNNSINIHSGTGTAWLTCFLRHRIEICLNLIKVNILELFKLIVTQPSLNPRLLVSNLLLVKENKKKVIHEFIIKTFVKTIKEIYGNIINIDVHMITKIIKN